MVNKKRCLLVITGAFEFEGGIAASTRLVIDSLIDAGYELDIFAFNEPVQAVEKYRKSPRVHYWTASNNKVSFTLAVWRALLSKRYTFAFSDHINVASVLAPAALLRLIRYTVRVHLVEALPPLLDFQGRLGMRFAWQIQSSEFAKGEVLKLFPKLKIDVVPLSVDKRASLELPTDSLRPEIMLQTVNGEYKTLGTRVILFVGRMAATEQYKGQDILIQAIVSCPEAQLVLAGKGDDLARLLALAKSLSEHVQARIFMPGYVSDELREQLYQTCYAFAMPSRGEGFGIVYLEAMRWAKPCIASSVDAAQDVIAHEQTGLLVSDPTDPQEVSEALLSLLNDPSKAQSYGEAGYQRLLKLFTYQCFRERFLQSLGTSNT